MPTLRVKKRRHPDTTLNWMRNFIPRYYAETPVPFPDTIQGEMDHFIQRFQWLDKYLCAGGWLPTSWQVWKNEEQV